jgi:hypothetical protein
LPEALDIGALQIGAFVADERLGDERGAADAGQCVERGAEIETAAVAGAERHKRRLDQRRAADGVGEVEILFRRIEIEIGGQEQFEREALGIDDHPRLSGRQEAAIGGAAGQAAQLFVRRQLGRQQVDDLLPVDALGQHAGYDGRVEEGRLAVRDAHRRGPDDPARYIDIENRFDRFVHAFKAGGDILRDIECQRRLRRGVYDLCVGVDRRHRSGQGEQADANADADADIGLPRRAIIRSHILPKPSPQNLKRMNSERY